MLQHALQYFPVIDADAEIADRHLAEHGVDDARDLGFGEVAQRLAVDDVDVALVELAEAPPLDLLVLTAPYALDLVASEGKRQLALAHCDIARERYRHVAAQRAPGLVVV